MLDNTTVEDMVRLFAGDGITIPQISNVFEWGQMVLAGWSTVEGKVDMPINFPILNHFLTGHQHEGISSLRGLGFIFIFHFIFIFVILPTTCEHQYSTSFHPSHG